MRCMRAGAMSSQHITMRAANAALGLEVHSVGRAPGFMQPCPCRSKLRGHASGPYRQTFEDAAAARAKPALAALRPDAYFAAR